jgi:hypothetical protein
LDAVKEGTKLSRFTLNDQQVRAPMLFSSGAHLEGACFPNPDIADSPTLLAGLGKRFTTKPPRPNRTLLRRLKTFVQQWVRENIRQLSPDTDTTVESWLKQTHYSDARKQELLEIHKKYPHLRPKDMRVTMFMKKESYPSYKHGRAINSRSDRFKTEVGPIFKAIEEVVFSNPWFIKHVPVSERARYVYDRIYAPGAKYIATDYTSFEAVFTAELMDAVEFELYDWVTAKLPNHGHFMDIIRSVLGGENHIDGKHIGLSVRATRMSGEMCTSLGNGFSNLMFMLFMCQEKGSKSIGVVEGDDGLFRIVGPIPTTADFAELGLIIKLDEHESLNEASFCGQVFDTESMTVIADPKKIMLNFGWLDANFLSLKPNKQKALLRAKAWSFGYQYPACPVISSLSRCYLRLTRSIDVRTVLQFETDLWKREQLLQAIDAGRPELNQEVHGTTRALMEKVYGFPVALQLKYEAYFDSLQRIEPIPCWFDVTFDQIDYFERYTTITSYPSLARYPPQVWRKVNRCPLPMELNHRSYVELWGG